MIRTTINLPTRLKPHLRLVKGRKSRDQKPLISSMGEVRRVRRGSKISRFFSLIFRHKNIKRFFGANMALAIMATSLFPAKLSSLEPELNVVSVENTSLETQRPIRYPVNDISITQGYRLFHPGIDLDGITGDTIYPVMPGVVEAVSRSKYSYGNAVLVTHSGGYTSLYAHLSKIYVAQGQELTTKHMIGEMGATGRAYGDHLHFEIRKNSVPVNPFSILPL